MEQWRDIEGFEGYQVSNYGRIKSLKRGNGKILKPTHDNQGYLHVILSKNGCIKNNLIHRLVAQAFLENPNHLPQVNHKDEDKTNNHVENLEWCDSKYNSNYGTCQERAHNKQSKRIDQIDMVTGEVIRKWASTMECGRNGYTQGSVVNCCNGLRKTHKGYIWKYAPM